MDESRLFRMHPVPRREIGQLRLFLSRGATRMLPSAAAALLQGKHGEYKTECINSAQLAGDKSLFREA